MGTGCCKNLVQTKLPSGLFSSEHLFVLDTDPVKPAEPEGEKRLGVKEKRRGRKERRSTGIVQPGGEVTLLTSSQTRQKLHIHSTLF